MGKPPPIIITIITYDFKPLTEAQKAPMGKPPPKDLAMEQTSGRKLALAAASAAASAALRLLSLGWVDSLFDRIFWYDWNRPLRKCPHWRRGGEKENRRKEEKERRGEETERRRKREEEEKGAEVIIVV